MLLSPNAPFSSFQATAEWADSLLFLSRLLYPARVLLISAKNLGNRRNSSFFLEFYLLLRLRCWGNCPPEEEEEEEEGGKEIITSMEEEEGVEEEDMPQGGGA